MEKELVDEKVVVESESDAKKKETNPTTKVAEDRTVINNGSGVKSLIKDLPKSVENIGTKDFNNKFLLIKQDQYC